MNTYELLFFLLLSKQSELVTGTCSDTEFACSETRCIPLAWLCDGRADCDGGLDEHTTLCHPHVRQNSTCMGNEIECQIAEAWRCIQHSWLCDGHRDCDDGTDEDSCQGSVIASPQFEVCGMAEAPCLSGGCVSKSLLCDGVFDCMDGSDENCTLDDDETTTLPPLPSAFPTQTDTVVESSVIEAPEPLSGDREKENQSVQVPVEVDVVGTIPIQELGPKIELGESGSTAVGPEFVTSALVEEETSSLITTEEETTVTTITTSTTTTTEEPTVPILETTSLPPLSDVVTDLPVTVEIFTPPLTIFSSSDSPTEPFSEPLPPSVPVEVPTEAYITPSGPILDPESIHPAVIVETVPPPLEFIPITAPIPPLFPIIEPSPAEESPKIIPALPPTPHPLIPIPESIPLEDLSNIPSVPPLEVISDPSTVPPWLKKQVQRPFTRRLGSQSSTVYPLQAILNPFPPLPPTLPPEQRHEYTLQPINASVHSGLPFFLARLFMPPTQRPTRSDLERSVDQSEPVKVNNVFPIVPVNRLIGQNSSTTSRRPSLSTKSP